MVDYRNRREMHKQTIKRGLWAIANHHGGLPAQCTAAWACGSYINRTAEGAAYPRFAIPDHAAEWFWEKYDQVYNTEFSKCASIGQRNPVAGVICLGDFEQRVRRIAAEAPLPVSMPRQDTPPTWLPFPSGGLPARTGGLPARTEFVPFEREEPRTYLPTPQDYEPRRRIQPRLKVIKPRRRIDPQLKVIKPKLPKTDITLVPPECMGEVIPSHCPNYRPPAATEPAPVAEPKAEGMSTNVMLGLAAGAAVVVFLLMRKK